MIHSGVDNRRLLDDLRPPLVALAVELVPEQILLARFDIERDRQGVESAFDLRAVRGQELVVPADRRRRAMLR